LHRDVIEWHHLPVKFHENLLVGTKVISGGHAHPDRQAVDLISLLSFLESWLIEIDPLYLYRYYSNA
jgi:hypothetical protein